MMQNEDPSQIGAEMRPTRDRPSDRPDEQPWAPGTPTSRVNAGRALAVVGAVGPVLYIVLVTTLGLLWDGYSPIRDTQSELGAIDAPNAGLMNVAGFMGLGISILAFSGAYHLLLRRSTAGTLATGLLAIAGVGMVVVGFFPCDAECVDVSRTSELHSAFSMPGAIGLPVAAMCSALAFRRDGRFSAAWQVVSFWLGVVSLASGPIVAAGLAEELLGLLQRAGMWPPLVWASAVSTKLYLLSSRSPPTRIGGT